MAGDWEARADTLAAEELAAGRPTGWFERLYAEAARGEVDLPWERDDPNIFLATWAAPPPGDGKRALVVGCGLGADAEYAAGLGYDTTAFDVSATAIALAQARHPGSPVHYRAASLLDPPAAWHRAFDLVIEVYTVQALPLELRAEATAQVSRFVAPGGRLVVVAFVRDAGESALEGPPWPLSPAEIRAFAGEDLTLVRAEPHAHPDRPAMHRWIAEFHG
jgi:SAM-dependent methyltransferase